MTESTRMARELKITAALYAQKKYVLEHVRNTGKLPDHINKGGFEIGMKILIRKRGTDITLSDDEQLVFNAILREKRLPGGGVILVED